MAFDYRVTASLLTQFYSLLSRTYFLRRPYLKLKSLRETLENPAQLRENEVVIAGQD